MKEAYKPTPEEIKKAEGMMDDNESVMSAERELTIKKDIFNVETEITPWLSDRYQKLSEQDILDYVEELKNSAAGKLIENMANDSGEVKDIVIEDDDEWHKSNGSGQVILKNGAVKEDFQVDADCQMAHSYTEHVDGYSIWWGYKRSGQNINPWVSIEKTDRKTGKAVRRRVDLVFLGKIDRKDESL